jgi:phosphohistidine phosphatase
MAPLELYLIRHGLAGVADASKDDRLRPLTRAGTRRTRAVARRLFDMGLRFDAVLTSPLVRARQTADILHAAQLGPRPLESQHLAPGGDFTAWLRWLRRWRGRDKRRLALVGHMPDLGGWGEVLVWGEARQRLVLKKAALLGLTLPASGSPVGRSLLFVLVPPRFLV